MVQATMAYTAFQQSATPGYQAQKWSSKATSPGNAAGASEGQWKVILG